MEEETPKKRGRPPGKKKYRNIHGGKVFTVNGKVKPGEIVELSSDEYESMKACFERAD